MTLGLKQAGFSVVGAVDFEPNAVKTYKANHKGIHVWRRDIRRLPAVEVMRKLKIAPGELDLLAGCPPCQGFSRMKTLNGGRQVDDDRTNLVLDFARYIKKMRPKAILMENVPGLQNDWRFLELLQRLDGWGYNYKHAVHNAADYGVPQRRKRLILMAVRNGDIDFVSPEVARRTVRDAIAHLPVAGQSGDPLHDLPERRSDQVRQLIAAIPKDGGSRNELPPDKQLACHQTCTGFKDVYGRMAWDSVSPTITSGCFNPSKGRFLHPTHDRAITMREAALLQSFPEDYKFLPESNKTAVALMIGNALPPEFIRCQAIQLGDNI